MNQTRITKEPTKEMLEAGARALMILDGCGLTIEGELVFCDDPRATQPSDSCICKAGARAAIEAAFAADIDEQAEKIAQVQAALKPLAAIPLWSDSYPDCDNDFIADYNLHLRVTVDQIKAARAARADEQGEMGK